MEWEEVLDRLRQYPYLDDDGNLHGFSQERPFTWQNCDQGLQYFLIARPIFFYFYEENLKKKTDRRMTKIYAESIGSHFSAAIDAVVFLKEIIEYSEGLAGKEQVRIKRNLDRIITELTELEPDWRQVIREGSRELARAFQYATGELSSLDIRRLTFLKLDLYYTLDLITNLTKANTLTHVAHLLDHFGVEEDADKDTLNRLVRRHGCKGKQAVARVWRGLADYLNDLPEGEDI
jgi:hypothetical protein